MKSLLTLLIAATLLVVSQSTAEAQKNRPLRVQQRVDNPYTGSRGPFLPAPEVLDTYEATVSLPELELLVIDAMLAEAALDISNGFFMEEYVPPPMSSDRFSDWTAPGLVVIIGQNGMPHVIGGPGLPHGHIPSKEGSDDDDKWDVLQGY